MLNIVATKKAKAKTEGGCRYNNISYILIKRSNIHTKKEKGRGKLIYTNMRYDFLFLQIAKQRWYF